MKRITERQHYANTSQLITDILKAVHAGQLKQGIERSVIEDSSKDSLYSILSILGVLIFIDAVQDFFDRRFYRDFGTQTVKI